MTVNNGGSVSPNTANYGAVTNFQLQPGSADGSVYIITITDLNDPNCQIFVTVQKDPCSNDCKLNDAGKTNEVCNDDGTPEIGADDFISFDLNPVGVNLGTGYNATVDNGGSVTPSVGSYGVATSFQLQPGSADGVTVYMYPPTRPHLSNLD